MTVHSTGIRRRLNTENTEAGAQRAQRGKRGQLTAGTKQRHNRENTEVGVAGFDVALGFPAVLVAQTSVCATKAEAPACPEERRGRTPAL